MKKIILFMAYYGKLPDYFDLWLKAVGFNKTIDFCIISDCRIDKEKVPKNVKIVALSFQEFKECIHKKLRYKISLKSYGRISQFRPAFGYIFSDIVRGYDYWGWIECDLIPGNIRKFLTDELLDKYDKFFKLGHFQLFRNNDTMNMLFMRKTPKALSSKFAFSHDILFFEELLGMHNIANAYGVKTYEENIFSDINYRRFMFREETYAYKDNREIDCIFSFNKGELIEYKIENDRLIGKEVLYVHLQKREMKVKVKEFDSFIIIPNQFIQNTLITKEYIEEVVSESKKEEVDYQALMKLRDKEFIRKQNRKISWWMLRVIRLRIKLFNGTDLTGK